jgi:hypothetical protein
VEGLKMPSRLLFHLTAAFLSLLIFGWAGAANSQDAKSNAAQRGNTFAQADLGDIQARLVQRTSRSHLNAYLDRRICGLFKICDSDQDKLMKQVSINFSDRPESERPPGKYLFMTIFLGDDLMAWRNDEKTYWEFFLLGSNMKLQAAATWHQGQQPRLISTEAAMPRFKIARDQFIEAVKIANLPPAKWKLDNED